MEWAIPAYIAVPFAASFLSAFFVRKLAVKFDIQDKPDGRKIHLKTVPLLGGVAIAIGVCASLGTVFHIVKLMLPLVIGGALILLVNLIDDIRGLSARFRIVAELAIALGVILSGIKISFLPPGPLGDLCEIIISLLWFVGLLNAFNYLDGMDGLAAGSAAINAFFFALILRGTGQHGVSAIAVILGASCLGFLPHNLRKIKMFMGDAGSTFIGFMIAGIAIMGNWAEDNVVRISIPLLILGVPIFDMTFTTVMRIRDGKIRTIVEWMKYTGRDHFHHYLADLGFSPRGVVVFIWTITAAFGLSAVMVTNDTAWEGVLTVLQALIIFGMIGTLMVAGRRRRVTDASRDQE